MPELNMREKVLAIATVVVILGFVGMRLLGGGGDPDSIWAVGGDDVDLSRAEYEVLVDQVGLAPDITERFVQLVGGADGSPASDDGTDRPDLDFQAQMAEWCKQEGIPTPDFDLETEDIRDVEDYQMIAVTTFVRNSDLRSVSSLLKKLELRGLIVQDVEIQSRLDSPSLDATIRAARIVPRFQAPRRAGRRG